MSDVRFIRNFVTNDEVTLTASTEDSEFPVSNLKDQVRSKVWRTTSATSQSVIIDLQTAEEIDSFAVLFRADQPIKLSNSPTLTLEASGSPDFTSPLLSQTVSLDDDNGVITHFFATTQEHRYWRFVMDDAANAYGYFEISNIVLSSSLKLDIGVGVGFKWSLLDQTDVSRTDFGQRFYDVKPQMKEFDFTIPLSVFSEYEDLLNFFTDVGSSEAICVALDTSEQDFDKDRFFIYGNLQTTYETTHTQGNYFNQGFKVTELL